MNSSNEEKYEYDLTEGITLSLNSSSEEKYEYDPTEGITLSLNGSNPTYDEIIHTITLDNCWSNSNKPFVDSMPSLTRVKEMCEEYPALKIAYNKFVNIYKMCDQDYKGKLKEKGIDDDDDNIPF